MENLQGNIPVVAALQTNRRSFKAIHVDEAMDRKKTTALRQWAKRRGLEIQYVPRTSLDAWAEDTRHGGVLAFASPRRYETLSEMLQYASQLQDSPFFMLLDGIEDPYNFGSALRCADAAGAHGIIMRKRDWGPAASIITRASAGASEHLAMAPVDDLVEAITHLKAAGITIVGTYAEASKTCYDMDLRGPILIAIGGERRGLGMRLRRKCDILVCLPMYGQVASLTASEATAIFAYEVLRQRRFSMQST